MLVRKVIDVNAPLTEEQKARLAVLKQMTDDDIVYDEDCPKLTEEQLNQFRRVHSRREKKIASWLTIYAKKIPLRTSKGDFRLIFASRKFAVGGNLFLASLGLFGVAAFLYGGVFVVLQAARHVFQLARKPCA